MSKSKSKITAHYVVHYIGNAAYIIGKQNGIDAICTRIDCERGHVIPIYNDGYSLMPTIDLAVKQAYAMQLLHSYASYRDAVLDGGPVAIDLYGIGLALPGRMKFYRLDLVVDGRAYRVKKRRRAQAAMGPNAKFDRFHFERSLFKRGPAARWYPELALGEKCVQLEYQAIVKGIARDEASSRHLLQIKMASAFGAATLIRDTVKLSKIGVSQSS